MSTPRLRPVDLARLAGMSTQQIRNYEEAGILPPASRTAAGYRTFEDVHRQALLTHRVLLTGYGHDTAQRVMRAVHAGDVPRALALVDEAHAVLHEQRGSLDTASEALEALAGRPLTVPPPRHGDLRIGEVAALLGVRTSALRVWEAAGLLAPARERGTAYRHYGPADVRDARMIHVLRQSRYPLPQIRALLEEFRRTDSDTALRAAIARRREELAARTTAMLEGDGWLYAYLRDQGHLPRPAPEAAQIPEASDDPEAAGEAAVVPGAALVPEATEVPEASDDPEAAQVPEASDDPEAAQVPEASDDPEAAQVPEASEDPEAGLAAGVGTGP